MAREATALPPLDIRYDDDPRVVKEAATEDYSRHVVPRTWRATPLSLIGSWWALASAMFWLIFAALIALAVGTVNALIGMALTTIAFGAINWILSHYAARTGTTVNLFSRTIFGYLGAALAPLIFGLTAIYYATFEGSIIAVAFYEYFGGLELSLWYLVVVLYSVPLVFGGVLKWLDKFNGFLLPFYVIGLIIAVIWTIVEFGYSNDWLTQEPETMAVSGPGWWFAFAAFMGLYIMMMYTWDYARYGRTTPEELQFNGWFTFGFVFYFVTIFLNGVVGIFLALNIPTEGPLTELSGVLGMVALMGLFAVALVWISQTRINTANFYLASSNLENFFARVFKVKIPRVAWAVIVGVVVYLFMLTNIFDILLQATLYQGVIITAWVAVTLTHIAHSRLRKIDPESWEWRPGRVPMFNWGGLGAGFAATAVGVVLLNFGGAWGDTWAPPLTFVTATIIYGVSLEFAKRSWFVMERPYDPRTEVDNPWEARIRCHVCGKYYIAQEMDRDPGAGYQPICQSDAQASPTFYGVAREDSQRHLRELEERGDRSIEESGTTKIRS
jgi:purine-cytosine permease-like protein